ncbi:MAG: hypothetical protein ACK5LM_05375 [Lactovum sp.]
MILKLFFLYFLSIYLILIVHEYLHFLLAKFLKYEVSIICVHPLAFKLVYENKNKALENLLIAAFSPAFLFVIGILLPSNVYTLLLKLSCLSNFFNLLPITADGEVILLSLVQIFRKRNL